MSIFSLTIGLLMVLMSILALQIAIAYYQAPQPQAILVLGGDFSRTRATVRLIQKHPNLKVWVSDYRSSYDVNSQIFRKAGIGQERIHYDFCATDTVTNFTCNIQNFTKEGIRHLYLVTSDYHMARSRTIATLVLGSRGIIVTPISVPSTGRQSESLMKILRDTLRAMLWMTTRRTGASFNPRLQSSNS